MATAHPYVSDASHRLDPEERDRMIVENLPLVYWAAHRAHESMPPSVALDDLISTGILGLIAAVDNYDPRYNVKLGTYALPRIRGAMLDSVRGLDGVSSAKRRQAREIQSAISALEQRLGRNPEESEVAAELELSVEQYLDTLQRLQCLRLTNLEAAEGEGRSLLNLLADREELEPSWNLEREELEKILARGVERLNQKERLVLTLYFYEELTLREIAVVMDVHLTRVSQLKTQALLRLRAYMERYWPTRGGTVR